MSPTGHKRWRAAVRFPRVSGDEPVVPKVKAAAAVFSPRERG